jgi:glutamate racemase
VSSIESFHGFLRDEGNAEEKRQQLVDLIVKIVKPHIVEHDSFKDTDIIKFKSTETTIRETFYEVAITMDYYRQYVKSMRRAIFVTITKDSVTQRNSKNFMFPADSDVDFVKSMETLTNYFSQLVVDKQK